MWGVSRCNQRMIQFWLDRGGTFTDVIAVTPTALYADKVPSRAIDHKLPEVRGMERLLQRLNASFDDVSEIRYGTTVATNALLEHTDPGIALCVTAPFTDILQIEDQRRPRLFGLSQPDAGERPTTKLVQRVLPVKERLSSTGDVLRPLDDADITQQLMKARRDGITGVAIVLLHADRFPDHETRVTDIASACGFEVIVSGSTPNGRVGYLDRVRSAVVEAYVTKPLSRHAHGMMRETKGAVLAMRSAGSLVPAQRLRGHEALLSGPAGGVVAGLATASQSRVIGVDVGGTSTDVWCADGDVPTVERHGVGGMEIQGDAVDIHSIAAGGGSVITVDRGNVAVGPRSAGADPGPACYGRGGPLTVTDVMLLAGRLIPELVPATFGSDGCQPLDPLASLQAAQALGCAGDDELELLIDRVFAVTFGHTTEACRHVATIRGIDPEAAQLVAFGGMGGQIACAVSDEMGLSSAVVPAGAGTLSAYGMGMASRKEMAIVSLECPATAQSQRQLTRAIAQAKESAYASVGAQPDAACALTAMLRPEAAELTFEVPYGTPAQMRAAFVQRYTHVMESAPPRGRIVVRDVRCQLTMATDAPHQSMEFQTPSGEVSRAVRLRAFEQWHPAQVYKSGDIAVGDRVEGGSVICDRHTQVVVLPGWSATRQHNAFLLTKIDATRRNKVVYAEVVSRTLQAICDDMGAVLQRRAQSVNIRDRRDFSCAVFDATGALLANAPHVPVHLGSMGMAVQALIRAYPISTLRGGDAFVTNDPYTGGTHLPDITMIMPVEEEQGVAWFVAARGHHADIGGIAAASMPPQAVHIDEEGCRLSLVRYARKGVIDDAEVMKRFRHTPAPTRLPQVVQSDLKAQFLSCRTGVKRLSRLTREYGSDRLHAAAAAMLLYMGERVGERVRSLPTGHADITHPIAGRIAVTTRREQGMYVIDLRESDLQGAHPFNAPFSVTRSVVLYALRTLLDEEGAWLPLNDGCLASLHILTTKGSILDATYPAAVCAGNVETSQQLCDVLLQMWGVTAASQGTMNNIMLEGPGFAFYETLGGGHGATPTSDGMSAAHAHMSNSALTDIEVLETRLPVVVEQLCLRPGSGGAGKTSGGQGMVRVLRALAPVTGALIGSRRDVGASGLLGGSRGQPGQEYVLDSGGQQHAQSPVGTFSLAPGEALVIKTPGGGGCGIR